MMRVSYAPFSSVLSRLLIFSVYIRIPLHQISIISTQNLPSLTLLLIGMIEISKITLSIYAYLNYIHMKSTLHLLLDISQSIFVFTFIKINLYQFSRGTDPSDRLQRVCIYTLLSSCIVEYILLFSYISYNVYLYVKRRYCLKQEFRFTYSPIIYYHPREFRTAHGTRSARERPNE